MKKQSGILSSIQWLVVLVALTLAVTQLSFASSISRWLVLISIGLSCVGFAEAFSPLIGKEPHNQI